MKNRAFVKYTKEGEIVPGSLIITNGGYPKGGPYKEIAFNLCCDSTNENILLQENGDSLLQEDSSDILL